jgi:hypothetical protein
MIMGQEITWNESVFTAPQIVGVPTALPVLLHDTIPVFFKNIFANASIVLLGEIWPNLEQWYPEIIAPAFLYILYLPGK